MAIKLTLSHTANQSKPTIEKIVFTSSTKQSEITDRMCEINNEIISADSGLEIKLGLKPAHPFAAPDKYVDWLIKKKATGYVMKLDDTVIGAVVVLDSLGDFPNSVWLSTVGIKEEYRHQGYGSKLLKHVMNELRTKTVMVRVLSNNDAAQKLYRSCGLTTEFTTVLVKT